MKAKHGGTAFAISHSSRYSLLFTATAMASEARHQLHVLFFPLMAPGHMIPMLDMAKLFACRGVRATIVTTHGNAHVVESAIARAVASGHHLDIHLLHFPSSTNSSLPEGCENLSSVPSRDQQMALLLTVRRLRRPLEQLLVDLRPHALVSDMFFPWTTELSRDLGIPRVVFHGTSIFSLSATNVFHRQRPHESTPEDAETFVLPGLPHRIELYKSQVPDLRHIPKEFVDMIADMREAEEQCYGVVANTFYELEPDYVRYYREVVGRRTWQVGPVSLCNTDAADKSTRGNSPGVDHHHILKWLDSQKPSSVVYICFGSLSNFSAVQMKEIAVAFESADHPFVWVVRNAGDGSSEWITEGLERKTVEGKGVIVRGWAPQILVLNHEAVGGFMTHCGWNSSLEGITAGVPLVTWPLFADQFHNERLLVDVVEIGVGVGSRKFVSSDGQATLVKGEEIRKAVDAVMDGGEEAEERRRRARELGVMAKKAMEEGGSSYEDLGRLIEDLRSEWNK